MFRLAALVIASCFKFCIPLKGQNKLTLSVFTGSGISFFGGPGAVNKSPYVISDVSSFPNTMVYPYGKKLFPNFLAGLQADIKLPSKWVLILNTQYEQTGGRLNTDTVYSIAGPSKVDGKYKRYYGFISVNPQVGKKILQKRVAITLHTGIDYGLKITQGEQFDYTNQNGQKSSYGYQGGTPETNDLRISFGGSISRKKWALDLNYKHGLSNYNKNGNDKVFSRLLHIRLLYAFLKA